MKTAAPFTRADATQTCFVYHAATGYVVHVHQFCPLEPGGRCAESDMARTALELVPEELPRSDLAVLHHYGELRLTPGHRYRVDPERKTFTAEPHASRPARQSNE